MVVEILRNIYTRPLRAYHKSDLEQSYEESGVWYIGLSIVFALPFSGIFRGEMPGGRAWAAAAGGVLTASAIWLAEACLIYFVVKKSRFFLPLEAFSAGVLWSAVALIPVAYLAGLALPSVLVTILHAAATAYLLGICVHSLSGLSLMGGLKVSLFAVIVVRVLATLLIAFVLMLIQLAFG